MGGARRRSFGPTARSIQASPAADRCGSSAGDRAPVRAGAGARFPSREDGGPVLRPRHRPELVELIKEGRRMLGDGITMALDFGYRWHDWYDAKWVLDRVADCDIYFAEAALQHDDLWAMRASRRAARSAWPAPSSRPPARDPRVDRGRQGRGGAAGHQPLRRPDRNPPHRRAVRAARRAGHPARVEDRDLAQCGRHFQAACPASPLFEFISPHVYESPCGAIWSRPSPRCATVSWICPRVPASGSSSTTRSSSAIAATAMQRRQRLD